jgi:heavy metal sensor kinase
MSRSLRWRIQIWHAAILAVVIVAFAALMYWQQRRNRFQEIDSELSAAVEVLVGKLQAAPPSALQQLANGQTDSQDSEDFQNLVDNLRVPETFAPRRVRHQFEAPYFAIFRDDGSNILSTCLDDSLAYPRTSREFDRDRGTWFRNRGEYREAYAVGPSATLVLTGRFIGKDLADLHRFLALVVGSGCVVFAIGLLGGWILSRKSIEPIGDISNVASEISAHDLGRRIDVSMMDSELAELATTLNDTFARLETAFQQQSQFTADASHELRTPLAVLRMHQELALSKPRTPEQYREAMETCQRATQRMTSLVESLMLLARFDSKESEPDKTNFDIASTIASVAQAVEPLAAARQIEITPDAQSAIVCADSEQIARVLTNLVTNAINYSSEGGAVRIRAQQTDQATRVTVADDGPGISAADAAKIFDRFYRVGQDRARDPGGSGLGLSICKSIIHSHGGSIGVDSEPGKGSSFWFTLPTMS